MHISFLCKALIFTAYLAWEFRNLCCNKGLLNKAGSISSLFLSPNRECRADNINVVSVFQAGLTIKFIGSLRDRL